MKYGAKLTDWKLTTEDHLNEICRINKEKQYGRYESYMISAAETLVEKLKSITTSCETGSYPDELGLATLYKLCSLTMSHDQCADGLKTFKNSISCQMRGIEKGSNEIRINLTMKLPSQDESRRESYFRVLSLPIYYMNGKHC